MLGKHMADNDTDAALDRSIYNADRARNCELLVETMKAHISMLRIELKDALFMAYGAETNWPKTAIAALVDIES